MEAFCYVIDTYLKELLEGAFSFVSLSVFIVLLKIVEICLLYLFFLRVSSNCNQEALVAQLVRAPV